MSTIMLHGWRLTNRTWEQKKVKYQRMILPPQGVHQKGSILLCFTSILSQHQKHQIERHANANTMKMQSWCLRSSEHIILSSPANWRIVLNLCVVLRQVRRVFCVPAPGVSTNTHFPPHSKSWPMLSGSNGNEFRSSCKYSSEVQSCHFGQNLPRLNLHTGMYYTKEDKSGFCTILESKWQDAICTHRQPYSFEISKSWYHSPFSCSKVH